MLDVLINTTYFLGEVPLFVCIAACTWFPNMYETCTAENHLRVLTGTADESQKVITGIETGVPVDAQAGISRVQRIPYAVA